MFKVSVIASLITLSAAIAATPAQAINLVQNGGFETGDLTGWIAGGFSPTTFVTNSGGFSALTATTSVNPGTLSQNLTGFTPGNEYQLSFFLNTLGSAPNGLTASVGSSQIVSLTDITIDGFLNYTANFTASGTSQTLTFSGFNNPDSSLLDDISVTDAPTAVPFDFSPNLGIGVLGGLYAAKKLSKKFLKKKVD
jgi:chitinase